MQSANQPTDNEGGKNPQGLLSRRRFDVQKGLLPQAMNPDGRPNPTIRSGRAIRDACSISIV